MRQISRRRFLQASSGVLAGIVSGCGPAGPAVTSRSQRELRIFVYAGNHENTVREVFVPRFQAAGDTRVTLYSGWWDAIAKLKTAPSNAPPFDLMITDATQGYPAAKEGLFAKINFARIPNHKSMTPTALDSWIYRDGFGLPYPDSVMTFAFHRGLVTPPPTRWSDLFLSRLAGKLGLYNSFYMSLYTFAAALADANGRPGSAHELVRAKPDEVFRYAREHREAVKLWWPTSTDMILALNDQVVSAGNMHSPEYLQAIREKPELAARVPDDDRAMVQVFWAIPAGTKNQDLAESALDLMFSEEVQLEFAQRGMATALPQVAAKMAQADPYWKTFYPHTDEQFRTLQYYPYDVYAEHWDEFADRWDRTILRGD